MANRRSSASLTNSLVNLQIQHDNQEENENARPSSTELLQSVNNSTVSLNIMTPTSTYFQATCSQAIIKLTGRFTTQNSRIGSLDSSSEEEIGETQTTTPLSQQKHQKKSAKPIKSPNKSVPNKTRPSAAQQYKKIRHLSQSFRVKPTFQFDKSKKEQHEIKI